jgi:hypothetical protein
MHNIVIAALSPAAPMSCVSCMRVLSSDNFCLIRYSGERVAQLTCSINLELPKEAIVVGTKGTLKLPAPFWCPTKLETPSVSVKWGWSRLLPTSCWPHSQTSPSRGGGLGILAVLDSASSAVLCIGSCWCTILYRIAGNFCMVQISCFSWIGWLPWNKNRRNCDVIYAIDWRSTWRRCENLNHKKFFWRANMQFCEILYQEKFPAIWHEI